MPSTLPPLRVTPKASEPRRPKPEIPEDPPRWRGPVLGVAVVIGIGLLIRTSMQGDAPAPRPPPVPTASAAPIPSEVPSSAPASARCAPASGQAFMIGEAPAAPRDPDGGDDEPVDSPFAVEVGRGTTWSGGFAVGALRDAEGGTLATVVILGKDGQGGKIVRLARARGDVDPPVVAGAGDAVIAAMTEPNAGGHSLKVAKIVGDDVTWGPELAEGRDESPAYDLAIGATRAALVWDDPSPDGKRSNIVLSTFDPATLRSATAARPISPPKSDADSPRIIPRAGGFWLAYIAHAEEAPPHPEKAAKKDKADGDDDSDLGETIAAAWVEMVPLDENGAPSSTPRRATPKDGHVLAFDLEPGDDGGAILAWRDDDTPSGSSGGSVSTAMVRLGEIGEPRLVADDGVGTGVPDLLPGWIAISSLTGPKRLAPASGTGELVGSLEVESALGLGELLASNKDGMLLATPAGKAMRLSIVRCEASDAGAH